MTAAPPTIDLKSRLEEMRASAAARGTRRGVGVTIEQMFLRILTLLLAMLTDFRAGRLPPLAMAGADARRRSQAAGPDALVLLADRQADGAGSGARAPRRNRECGEASGVARFGAAFSIGNDIAMARACRIADCAWHAPGGSARHGHDER